MKKLLSKILLIFSMVVISWVLLWFVPGNYNHELAAIINKAELLKKTPSPRLILIGGSGIYTGLDSRLIEKATGLKVINLGLYVGFGLRFPIEIVRPEVKQGDIVLIIPEYIIIDDASITDITKSSREWLLAINPGLYKKIFPFQSYISDIVALMQLKAQAFIINIFSLNFADLITPGAINYNRRFNGCGDIRKDGFSQRKPEEMAEYGRILNEMDLSEGTFSFLNEFAESVNVKGGQVLLTFCAIPDGEYGRNKKEIESLYLSLHNKSKITILGKPSDFVYSYQYFSNSVYHLNNQGKPVRTKKIIALLKTFLNNGDDD